VDDPHGEHGGARRRPSIRTLEPEAIRPVIETLRLSSDAGIRAGDAGDRESQHELAARLQHEKEHLVGLRDAIKTAVSSSRDLEGSSPVPATRAPARTSSRRLDAR
jgi:hypothetical protein